MEINDIMEEEPAHPTKVAVNRGKCTFQETP